MGRYANELNAIKFFLGINGFSAWIKINGHGVIVNQYLTVTTKII